MPGRMVIGGMELMLARKNNKELERARPERWCVGVFYDPSLGPHQKQLIKLQDFLGCMHSRYSACV